MFNKCKAIFGLILVFAMLCSASVFADTSNFKGVNWADERDNFVQGWVIPCGLLSSYSYNQCRSVGIAISQEFQNDVGANTIRLPINHQSVLESWWGSYKGAIDGAVSAGMKVILAYWEGVADGYVDDIDDFWDMWDQVVDDYGSNSSVYFEVMNEPHGYSASALRSLYTQFLNNFSSVPDGRVILGGTGYSEYVRDIGGYFPNCLLSQHLYAFWYSQTSTDAWEADLRDRIGSYASRTILTEFGAPMTTGINYNGAQTTNYIRYICGMTNQCRDWNMGSCYWPGVRDNDTYRLCNRSGTSLSITNQSGLDRIQYGWGDSGSTPTPTPTSTPTGGGDFSGYYLLKARHSGKVADVYGQSTSDGANICQWSQWGGYNQQFEAIHVTGTYYKFKNRNSGKVMEVENASTTNGANVQQYSDNGSYCQQWSVELVTGSYYRLINRNSGKALDVSGASTSNGANILQWTYNGATNQQWELVRP